MTPEQAARIEQVRSQGHPVSLQSIPDGSWLLVKREGGRTWIEILEPYPTILHAFDFDDGKRGS